MTSSIVALLALMANTACAQDALERARQAVQQGPPQAAQYAGRDRADLRMPADLRYAGLHPAQGSGRIGVDATLDFDFACGNFDVGASLRSLFSKNMREEFLGSIMGYIESELVRNALVLACEASPTLCQALQHYRVNAQAMLGMNYDRCRTIQQAVDGSLERQRAEAIKACVDEKRRANPKVPLDQALYECQGADKVRSLSGDRTTELDLVEELRKALKLDEDGQGTLGNLLGDRVRHTAQGGKGEIAKSAVEEEYVRIRERYEQNWEAAVAAVSNGQTLPSDMAAGLVPPAAPPVTAGELAELALVRPPLRRVLVASVAAQSALLELVRRVHEVERNLEVARKLPSASAEFVKKLDREREDLRSELGRLVETHERQNAFNQTLLAATGVVRSDLGSRTVGALGSVAVEGRRSRIEEETQKWGSSSARNDKESAGPGCGDCPPLTWSFGSVGGRR